jgi:pyruvate/2-oxoglutarate dehydrogenase complex dihydrolipoamide dehydrogenase (E3) component
MSSSGPDATHFDMAIIGAGTASETLVSTLGSSMRIVVFEPGRVGGECPFVACIPSKAILHVAATSGSWADAVTRRDAATHHLDDSEHSVDLRRHGAVLVRSSATITSPTTVEAGGRAYTADHIVIATGSAAAIPEIDGLEPSAEWFWTSDDALTAVDRPDSLVILGGGVIGCELASAFGRLGVTVTLLDEVACGFPDLHTEVGQLVDDGLRRAGVDVRRRSGAVRFEATSNGVLVVLDDGDTIITDRVLVAVGKQPRTAGIGLESVGLDPGEPLPVIDTGRLDCDGSVWAIGDVAGKGQYTHVANHQARVVADHLVGSCSRRFDDVVTSACMFTDPPMITVGPTCADLDGDRDVVWATAELSIIPRQATDDLAPGFLAVAARRSSRCVVAAHGAGEKFDELVHAIVIAVDGAVPLDRLVMSMQPFPTIGEILHPLYSDLLDSITEPTP